MSSLSTIEGLLNRDAFWLLCCALFVTMGGCASPKLDPVPPSPPLGLSSRVIQQLQINRGRADEWVIYAREWSDGGENLSDAGARHLADLGARLEKTRGPIIVERERDADLNDRHLALVARFLYDHGFGYEKEWVVIGTPVSPGIDGDEAIDIRNSMLRAGTNSGANSQGGGSRGGSGREGR